ncbi:ATP-binding protein [Streptomyces sp. NPDC058646]|uniref:ATP-binding protein n=1 Tax=Streptomyces sp. NPDC058646 TaxID=3346574 RepID=UPI0036619497
MLTPAGRSAYLVQPRDPGPAVPPGPSVPHRKSPPRPATSVRGFVHWVADPVAANVPQVRARLRVALDEWRVSGDLADVLLLAVGELVGNVVRHAANGRMRVALTWGGGWLRLEVADQGACLPRLPSPRAAADLDSEGGRGLLIVHLLATERGGELSVVAGESGKSVRMRVPAA